MTPVEMARECARAMTEPGLTGVVLTIPKGKMPKSFPRGELLNEAERNGIVERTLYFKPVKVLAWLIKNEKVVMTRLNSTTLQFEAPKP